MNTKSLQQVKALAHHLKQARYKIGILTYELTDSDLEFVRTVERDENFAYFDLLLTLLPQLAVTHANILPTLGAYNVSHLISWVEQQGSATGPSFVIINNLEPLLVTFGSPGKVVRFFKLIQTVEPLKPVLLITYLKQQVTEADFPTERLLSLTSH